MTDAGLETWLVFLQGIDLPEFASFHSDLGGQYLFKVLRGGDDARNMLDYHGLSSVDDVKKLEAELEISEQKMEEMKNKPE